MPVALTVKLVIGRQQREMMRRLQSQHLAAFFRREQQNATRAVQDNVVRMGNGGGTWPPLAPLYAARKLAGKTPGRGRYGYSMLRDSGSMWQGITAVMRVSARNITIGVTSVGQKSGRPSNAEILLIHARRGRNPAADMRKFQTELHARLEAYLAARTR